MKKIILLGGWDELFQYLNTNLYEVYLIQMPDKINSKQIALVKDYRITDIKSVKECIESINSFNLVFDAIVCFTEDGLETTAHLSKNYYISSNQGIASIITKQKNQMRSLLMNNDKLKLDFLILDEFSQKNWEKITLFLNNHKKGVLKPVDGSGSEGVYELDKEMIVWEKDTIQNIIANYRNIILEEFIEGHEFSVESFSWKNNHKILAITEKITTGSPNYIETGHNLPAKLSPLVTNRIEEVITEFLNVVGHTCGPCHTEIKLSRDTSIKIIESQTRVGGDRIWEMCILKTDFNVFHETVMCLLRDDYMPIFNQEDEKYYSIRFLISNTTGVIDRISINQEVLHEIEPIKFNMCCEEGDHIKQAKSSSDRLGYVMCYGNSSLDSGKKCEKIIETINIETKNYEQRKDNSIS